MSAGLLLHCHDRTSSGTKTLMAGVPLLSGKQCGSRWRSTTLPAALEFCHGRGHHVATLVEWAFDCSDSHSVWEPSSPS